MHSLCTDGLIWERKKFCVSFSLAVMEEKTGFSIYLKVKDAEFSSV